MRLLLHHLGHRGVRARLAVSARAGAVLLLLSGILRTATILTPSVATRDGRKALVCHGYYHTATRGKEDTRSPGSTLPPHVHGHRHAARSSAQRICWAYDRSPGYPWPPVRGSRLWHARVVLHPVCTAAGRPAASVLQSSARREQPAYASTAFFAFVAYSSDDSNFARGTNFVMKSVGFASSRTCPISQGYGLQNPL